MARIVVIHSRAGAGFRRGGIAHAQGRAEHPIGVFTEGQLKAIQAEPLLDAEIVGEADEAAEKKAALAASRAAAKSVKAD